MLHEKFHGHGISGTERVGIEQEICAQFTKSSDLLDKELMTFAEQLITDISRSNEKQFQPFLHAHEQDRQGHGSAGIDTDGILTANLTVEYFQTF